MNTYTAYYTVSEVLHSVGAYAAEKGVVQPTGITVHDPRNRKKKQCVVTKNTQHLYPNGNLLGKLLIRPVKGDGQEQDDRKQATPKKALTPRPFPAEYGFGDQ
jgi:hypothetical protein